MSSPLIQEIDNLLLLKLNELPKHDKNWRNLITGGLSLVISIHQNDQLYFWITIWRKHLTSTNLDLDFAWGTNKQKYYSPVLVDFPLGAQNHLQQIQVFYDSMVDHYNCFLDHHMLSHENRGILILNSLLVHIEHIEVIYISSWLILIFNIKLSVASTYLT